MSVTIYQYISLRRVSEHFNPSYPYYLSQDNDTSMTLISRMRNSFYWILNSMHLWNVCNDSYSYCLKSSNSTNFFLTTNKGCHLHRHAAAGLVWTCHWICSENRDLIAIRCGDKRRLECRVTIMYVVVSFRVVVSMGICRKDDLEVCSLVETISPETCFVLKGG